MKKNKIVLGFARLTDARLEEKAKAISIAMESNPNFPTPNPCLSELKTDLNAFSQALANSNAIIKKEKRLCLEVTLSNLAYNVSFAANNDYDKLVSSGFNVHKAEEQTPATQDAENSQLQPQKNREQNLTTFLYHPASA